MLRHLHTDIIRDNGFFAIFVFVFRILEFKRLGAGCSKPG